VQSGDSPWTIAQKVYGDGTKYKLIMDANGLTDQTRLRVGMVLTIPSLSGTPAPLPVATNAPSAPTNTAPTVAPLPSALPSSIPATPVPTIVPLPTATPTPPSPVADALPTIINTIGAFLLIVGFGCAVLAFLRFRRTRHIEQLSSSKQSIRIKQ
jgi:hypothetical protein